MQLFEEKTNLQLTILEQTDIICPPLQPESSFHLNKAFYMGIDICSMHMLPLIIVSTVVDAHQQIVTTCQYESEIYVFKLWKIAHKDISERAHFEFQYRFTMRLTISVPLLNKFLSDSKVIFLIKLKTSLTLNPNTEIGYQF